MHWGMLIDLRKCVGCYGCTVVCQLENGLPATERWSKMLKVGPFGEYPNVTAYSMPLPCMHCQDAPCVKDCPTKASRLLENGVVVVDTERCIGCKLCMLVCPYGVRCYNEETGVVEKCKMCVERLERGEMTRCTEACQLKARYSGDLDDPDSEIVHMIRKYNAKPLHEEFGTKPSVYYIMP